MSERNSMTDRLQKAAAELFVLSFLMIEDSYPYQLVKDIKIMTMVLWSTVKRDFIRSSVVFSIQG